MQKKDILFFVGIAVIGISVFSFSFLLVRNATANPSQLTSENCPSTSAASTSVAYMTPGTGTTTCTMVTVNTELVDIGIQFNASDTAATLSWEVEFSRDGIDWYGEDGRTLTSNIAVTHGSTTPVHSWNPQVAGISRKSITLSDLASELTRVRFYVTGGNGSFFAVKSLKQEF